jgi:protein-S-isoprenylcysteine O-methyltransferase Ste14
LALAAVLITTGKVESGWLLLAGAGLVTTGQVVRLWAVRHIGVISRTRATPLLGPLVMTGPYARTRNPLYVGNWLLWTGFVLGSRLLWMLPLAWVLFAVHYGAMARWEERLLHHHFSDAYRAYSDRVRRWWPSGGLSDPPAIVLHPWSQVLFSERGTLAAVGLMVVLLAAKEMLM